MQGIAKLPSRLVPHINTMTNPDGESCAECRCFASGPVAPNVDVSAPRNGMCRRFPPKSAIVGMQQGPNGAMIPQLARVPQMVASSEWCEEFKRKVK